MGGLSVCVAVSFLQAHGGVYVGRDVLGNSVTIRGYLRCGGVLLEHVGARVGWTTTGVEPARAAYKTHSTRRRAEREHRPLTSPTTGYVADTDYLRNIGRILGWRARWL